jgi:predicted  nucleic acid-binding Zn-ribbon protein
MDLLACTKCGDQFYLPGAGHSAARGCPNCGGDLCLALRDTASIPLDARWLDRSSEVEAPTVTARARAAHPIGAR